MVTLLAWMACEQEIELDVCTILKSNKGTHTKIGVLKETDKVGFAGFLQSHHGRALEAKICLKILSDFPDETLERKLADEKFGGFLVAANLAESDSAGSVPA